MDIVTFNIQHVYMNILINIVPPILYLHVVASPRHFRQFSGINGLLLLVY